MAKAKACYDAPDLVARIEQLSQHELDRLPFGVVRLDRQCVVRFFSETETRESGYDDVLGKNFFEVSQCAGKNDLRARVTQAMEEGAVDLEFAFPGTPASCMRELRIRVLSARDGGVWMFMERDPV